MTKAAQLAALVAPLVLSLPAYSAISATYIASYEFEGNANDTSGQNVTLTSGNNHLLTYTLASHSGTKALSLAGADYLKGDFLFESLPQPGLTIEMWVSPGAPGCVGAACFPATQELFWLSSANTDPSCSTQTLDLGIDALGYPYAEINGYWLSAEETLLATNSPYAAAPLAGGVWNKIKLAYDGVSARLYVNGTEAVLNWEPLGGGNGPFPAPLCPGSFTIGGAPAGAGPPNLQPLGLFTGAIDEVRVAVGSNAAGQFDSTIALSSSAAPFVDTGAGFYIWPTTQTENAYGDAVTRCANFHAQVCAYQQVVAAAWSGVLPNLHGSYLRYSDLMYGNNSLSYYGGSSNMAALVLINQVNAQNVPLPGADQLADKFMCCRTLEGR